MKLSVCLPIVYPELTLDEALRRAGELGYLYAECWRVRDEEVAPLKRAISESGVTLLSIVADDFVLNDASARERWLSHLRACAMRARALGASFIVTQVGQETEATREEQYASVLAGLRAALPILKENGITLLIEPLNTKVNHKGYLMEKSAEAFALVEAVGSPLVRVVYDIYHQQISEGNIIPTIIENLDKIAHLHGAANPGRCEIFLGENDYRVILRAVQEAGYEGAMTLEYHPTLPPDESLRKTLEYMNCQ